MPIGWPFQRAPHNNPLHTFRIYGMVNGTRRGATRRRSVDFGVDGDQRNEKRDLRFEYTNVTPVGYGLPSGLTANSNAANAKHTPNTNTLTHTYSHILASKHIQLQHHSTHTPHYTGSKDQNKQANITHSN